MGITKTRAATFFNDIILKTGFYYFLFCVTIAFVIEVVIVEQGCSRLGVSNPVCGSLGFQKSLPAVDASAFYLKLRTSYVLLFAGIIVLGLVYRKGFKKGFEATAKNQTVNAVIRIALLILIPILNNLRPYLR